jgi:hypothetical protein
MLARMSARKTNALAGRNPINADSVLDLYERIVLFGIWAVREKR